jgi:ribonuclease HII
MPSFAEEKLLESQGKRRIAGLDEVGRGSLAGPVVAAAVIMPSGRKPRWYSEVDDSKVLTPEKRSELSGRIREKADAFGIGTISHDIIDSLGIVKATQMAMMQAIEQISPPPDSLLIDFLTLPDIEVPQKGIVDGDALCFSIACASIIAKVYRDSLMDQLDGEYPGYGFSHNKGYGTPEHVEYLRALGPCPIHRRTFDPLKEMLLQGRLF